MPKPTATEIEDFKKSNPEALETFDISGVELFAVGTWNGDKYSASDLDEMVRAHREIGDQIKPFMKLGHSKEQALLKSGDMPAAGWIHNVRREGDRLVADIKNLPKKIYQLLKAKAYMRRSAEVLCNVKIGGKAYKYALKACAFLGGEMPAVHTLDDVLALYAANGEAIAFNDENADHLRAYDITLQETETMATAPDDKDLRIKALEKELSDVREGKVKEFAAANESLTAANKDLTDKLAVEKARADKAEGEVREHAEKAEIVEINAKIDGLIAKKKVAPAQREAVFAMLKAAKGAAEKMYSVGGKEQSLDAIVREFFDKAPDLDINVESGTETGKEQDLSKASRAKEYAAKNKVSYEDALIVVDKQDAQTAKAASV